MLAHFLTLSLPNLLSIYAAMLLFATLFPTRPDHRAARAVLVGALFVTLAYVSMLLNALLVPSLQETLPPELAQVPIVLFFSLVVFACVPVVRIVCDVDVADAMFCCSMGYALQNLAHGIWSLASPFLGLGQTDPLYSLTMLATCAVFYGIAYVTVVGNIRVMRLTGTEGRGSLALMVGVVLVCVVFDQALIVMGRYGGLSLFLLSVLRLVQVAVCGLLLLLIWEMLYSSRLERDVAAQRQLAADERRQYQISRETIDAINLRCHDIKHQIRHLGSQDEAKLLEEVADKVAIYDTAVQTGNPALDVVLFEKGLLARSRGVELLCMVDGSALVFMAEPDLYSLFGNALDNAIEAVGQVEDPDSRLVDVSVRREADTAVIEVRNYCAEEPTFVNGIPQTTKENTAGQHGFGMRTIRMICDRYDGTLCASVRDGMFVLGLTLPIA